MTTIEYIENAEMKEEDDDDNTSNTHVTYGGAPDGGWGWVIVFAVFMGNFLIDGCIGCFGIFYPVLLQTFNASPAMTSMAGSVIVGVFLFSSPFVGGLINRFGCRTVCFIGGCVAAAGFFCAIASKDIVCFMLTYGVIGGIGMGMNSLTGHVMVNMYFNEKRGIANGIVSSGAGFGVFVLAPITQLLLAEYGWRGAMVITSGIVMQFCVCATLMRPLHVTSQNVMGTNINNGSSEETSSANDGGYMVEQPLLKNKTIHVIQEAESCKPKLVSDDKSQRTSCIREKYPSNFSLHNMPKSIADHTLCSSNINSLPDLSKEFTNMCNVRRKCVVRNTQNDDQVHHHHQQQQQQHHQANPQSHISPLLRKDIFYSGSLHHLKDYNNADSVSNFIQSVTLIQPEVDSLCSTSGTSTRKPNACKTFKRLSRLCDLSIFSHTVYIPMLLGGVFTQMAQFIPSTFVPEDCLSLGLDKDQVTIIIALYGVFNIFGRLSAGCLANIRRVSPLWLCNFGTFMCGVCCALYPLCKTFPTLCICMSGFGYFIGYFPPLQVIIMVDYLGLDKLTSAVGFLQMAKGPAAIIGPPLAGVVFEWTKDYAMSLEVAAVLFMLAAGIQSLVPVIDRCSKKREHAQLPTTEITVSVTEEEYKN